VDTGHSLLWAALINFDLLNKRADAREIVLGCIVLGFVLGHKCQQRLHFPIQSSCQCEWASALEVEVAPTDMDTRLVGKESRRFIAICQKPTKLMYFTVQFSSCVRAMAM